MKKSDKSTPVMLLQIARMYGKHKPIFKNTYNEFLKTCLIGLTGDAEVLNDFSRVKSCILRNHDEKKFKSKRIKL